MSKYTEAEIARIISECEVLFIPEGSTLDDIGYTTEPLVLPKISNPKSLLLSRYLNESSEICDDNTVSEDFEKIFQDSKQKKSIIDVSLMILILTSINNY